jgi:hypothetical protein
MQHFSIFGRKFIILLVSYTLHSQIFAYHTYNDRMQSSGIQGCQALHGLNLFMDNLCRQLLVLSKHVSITFYNSQTNDKKYFG